MGTFCIICISTGSFFSFELILHKKWFPQVLLEITDRNEVPRDNILVGFPFLTVISRGT
jgi:hypothetical protein